MPCGKEYDGTLLIAKARFVTDLAGLQTRTTTTLEVQPPGRVARRNIAAARDWARRGVDGRTVLQQARLGAAIALHCASSTMHPRMIEVHPFLADNRESRRPGESEPLDIT